MRKLALIAALAALCDRGAAEVFGSRTERRP